MLYRGHEFAIQLKNRGNNPLAGSITLSSKVRKSVKNIKGMDITEYFYDNAGNRFIKKGPGGTTVYLRHGQIAVAMDIELLADTQEELSRVNRYVLSGDLLAGRITEITKADLTTETEVSYYHLDHLNSTKCVTDENGVLVVMYEYRAFGEQLKRLDANGEETDDSAKYSYGGKELDGGTNLYYFNARYYDATIGRFINVDPVQDGSNWYVYCSNNPLCFIDMTGLDKNKSEKIKAGDYTFTFYVDLDRCNIIDTTIDTFSEIEDDNLYIMYGRYRFEGRYLRNLFAGLFLGGSSAQFEGTYTYASIYETVEGKEKHTVLLSIEWTIYPGMKGLGIGEETKTVNATFDVTGKTEKEIKYLLAKVSLQSFKGIAKIIKKDHQSIFFDTLKKTFLNVFVRNPIINADLGTLSDISANNNNNSTTNIVLDLIQRDMEKNSE